jgi:hypothetical protein
MADIVPLTWQQKRVLDLLVAEPADWNRDLASSRNAHETNSANQLIRALREDKDVLEGDVRLDRENRLVMAHTSFDDGMDFQTWHDYALRSGRGVKIDIKTDLALPKVLALTDPGADNQYIFNIYPKEISRSQIEAMIQKHPDAYIALSPGSAGLDARYSQREIDILVRAAEIIGNPGRVTFPLENRGIRRDIVAKLKPYGSVSVWNIPALSFGYGRQDMQRERDKLRALGVNGMVDLQYDEADLRPDLEPLTDLPDMNSGRDPGLEGNSYSLGE